MDFDFTDDQESLRDAVRRWVDKGYDFERRRGIVKAGGFSREAWQRDRRPRPHRPARCPKRTAASASAPVEAMVVMEELGRGLVLEPYAHGALVATSAARRTRRRRCSRSLAAAHRRGQGRSSCWRTRSAARATASAHVDDRRARQRPTPGSSAARRASCRPATRPIAFIVPARVSAAAIDDAAGIGLFLVERGAARRRRCAATRRRTARAPPTSTLNDAAGDRADRAPGAGFAALEHAVDVGIAALCAEAVGAMDKLVALTVEYMNTRKQFGVPIAHLPGAAPPHRRRQDAARAGALDELLREPEARRGAGGAAARAVAGQGAARPRRCASSASSASSCTAASASPTSTPASHYFKRLTVHRDDLRRHAAPPRRGVARMQDTAGVFA